MPDRVYTTQEQKQGLGPTEVINTIDRDKVAAMLQEIQGELVPAASDPLVGYAAMVESAKKPSVPVCDKCGSANCTCPAVASARKRKVPSGGKCVTCGTIHPCACDVGKARMAGDDIAVGVMNELRNQRRYAMLGQYEEAGRLVVAEEQQRQAERQAIAEGLAALEEAVGTEAPAAEAAVASSDPKFKSVDELTASQRTTFAKWAEKQGWPKEYVEAFITPKTAEVDDVPEHIMVVATRKDLAPDVRQGLIVAMCREAKLKPEQASRVKKYWTTEVGMPADWVDELVEEPDIK